jgi:hypothetical protein
MLLLQACNYFKVTDLLDYLAFFRRDPALYAH